MFRVESCENISGEAVMLGDTSFPVSGSNKNKSYFKFTG